jgi:hypothetical protein
MVSRMESNRRVSSATGDGSARLVSSAEENPLDEDGDASLLLQACTCPCSVECGIPAALLCRPGLGP